MLVELNGFLCAYANVLGAQNARYSVRTCVKHLDHSLKGLFWYFLQKNVVDNNRAASWVKQGSDVSLYCRQKPIQERLVHLCTLRSAKVICIADFAAAMMQKRQRPSCCRSGNDAKGLQKFVGELVTHISTSASLCLCSTPPPTPQLSFIAEFFQPRLPRAALCIVESHWIWLSLESLPHVSSIQQVLFCLLHSFRSWLHHLAHELHFVVDLGQKRFSSNSHRPVFRTNLLELLVTIAVPSWSPPHDTTICI